MNSLVDLCRREHSVEVPSAQDGADLDVEDLRSPWDGIGRQQATEGAAPDGVDDEFDAAEASMTTGITPRRLLVRQRASRQR